MVNLLESLLFSSHDLIVACNDLSPQLQSIRDRLLEIKKQLGRRELTHKWTLRQSDLFIYQHQLHDIVKLRCYGNNKKGEIALDPTLANKFCATK